MQLTERDRAIVAAVAEYRILRRDQIQSLFFPSARTSIRALARLYHHRYLARLRPYVEWGRGDSPTIYTLDKDGIALLSGSASTTSRHPWHKAPGRYFLAHTLALNDVRIAVTLAAAQHGIVLERWIGEDEFRRQPDMLTCEVPGKGRVTRAIRPDAACVLKQPHYTSRLLVEIDMATEDNRRFVREKVRPGVAYLASEAYKQRFGFQSGRWLVITTSAQRLHNMKRATEAAVGRAAAVFYFTTFSQVRVATILTTPIWWRGGEARPCALLKHSA